MRRTMYPRAAGLCGNWRGNSAVVGGERVSHRTPVTPIACPSEQGARDWTDSPQPVGTTMGCGEGTGTGLYGAISAPKGSVESSGMGGT